MAEAQWYVAHTITGYENKVKANLEQTIKNRNLEEMIQEVAIPMQDVVEIKNGVRKATQKKMFPGYVLVKMIMNEENWYIVRNTHGVTGFVGPGGKAVPLTEDEINKIGIGKEGIVIDLAVGDAILVVNGVWEGTVGNIKDINASKQTLTILVDMFGRETPVELDFSAVRKM